jgi:hypothetical protein
MEEIREMIADPQMRSQIEKVASPRTFERGYLCWNPNAQFGNPWKAQKEYSDLRMLHRELRPER